MKRNWQIAVALISTVFFTGTTVAGELYGLLRERDLTPFGILRLDMKPAYSLSIEPGEFAVETNIGYQNTWALSPNVEKYLTSIEPLGRHRLNAADVQAIQNLPGENYLVDTELALIDVTFHYKFSTYWTGYAQLSGVSYQGGFLDSTIEQFHKTFGFSTFGRPAVQRNDVNLILDLKNTHVTSLGAPTSGGFTDPTFGLRYAGINMPQRWHLVLEGSVKVPVQSRQLLVSTGRADYGLQASLQRVGEQQAFYLSTAAVYYAGTLQPARQQAQVVPTVVIGYEHSIGARTTVNLQGYVSKSVYSRKETDLDELLGNKFQVSLGMRHRKENFLFTFGITENLQNVNNTPDIGVQLGIAYVPLK